MLQVSLSSARRELQAVEGEILKAAQHLHLPGLEAALVHAPTAMEEKRDRVLRRIRQLVQEHRAIAAELGLTPSARSRAGWGSPAAPKTEAEDPWKKLAEQG